MVIKEGAKGAIQANYVKGRKIADRRRGRRPIRVKLLVVWVRDDISAVINYDVSYCYYSFTSIFRSH